MRSLRLGFLTLLLAIPSAVAKAEEGPHWGANLDEAKRQAAATNRLVLIHFWAPWCGPCMRLESTVFLKPGVAQSMESRYVPVKVNAQDFPATCRQFGVERLPTDVIVTPSGKVLQRLQCPQDPLLYSTQLIQVSNSVANSGPKAGAEMQLAAAPTVPLAAPTDSGNPFRNTGVVVGSPPANQSQVGICQGISPQINPRPPSIAAAASHVGAAPFMGAPPASGQTPAASSPVGTNANPSGAIDSSATVVSPVGAIGPMPSNVASGLSSPTIASDSRPSIFSSVPENPTRPSSHVAPAATTPSSAPSFGLDGYCPVTLIERSMVAKNDPRAWLRGDMRWGAVHRGVTYLFTGPEEQKKFLASPDRYAPVLSGNDVVLAFDKGRLEPGRREFGMFSNGRIYLFTSAETLAKFIDRQNTDRYIDLAWRAENPQSTTR